MLLNTVQRALNARCDYVAGSIRSADIAHNGLQACPLAAATQDARLWRALPELVDKGASLAALPALAAAGPRRGRRLPRFRRRRRPPVLRALAFLADSDPRAVRHDVFRMLSCPNARSCRPRPGPRRLARSRQARARHDSRSTRSRRSTPSLIGSRFARELQVAGHTPQTPRSTTTRARCRCGFEEALRNEPLGRARVVALRAAAARQPGAAEPRRADGLGAAAARAAARLPARPEDAGATWSAS